LTRKIVTSQFHFVFRIERVKSADTGDDVLGGVGPDRLPLHVEVVRDGSVVINGTEKKIQQGIDHGKSDELGSGPNWKK
jgi:hypothetical protein